MQHRVKLKHVLKYIQNNEPGIYSLTSYQQRQHEDAQTENKQTAHVNLLI